MRQFFKFAFATVIGLIIFSFLSFILLFIGLTLQLPSSEAVKENSVLHLKLEGNLIERSKNDWYSLLDSDEISNVGLDDILTSIQLAKKDPNIKGIYLNPGIFRAGYASLSEIRKALIDFKESEKFIVAYSGNYTQGVYYLSTAADMIYMNKQGILDFRGIASSTLFFKKMLEKVGVDMQIVKVGTYKSFTEQFTNEAMSEANKEQMTLLTHTVWDNIVGEISKSRYIPKDTLLAAADKFLTFQSPEKIVKMQMVDELAYSDEIEKAIKEFMRVGQDTKVNYVKPSDLLDSKFAIPNSDSQNKIAVVYAVGEIDNGDTEGIRSSELSRILRKLEQDSTVKSVVLRVNSPGGSAYGSEQIWRAVSLLKEKKPVIVSMGDYAASGGYYISCSATKIVANPNTITGSIGIFGVIPNLEGLMDKIGVSYDVVKTNKFSDMPNLYRAMGEDERNMMQQYVDRGYHLFVRRCAEGRKMPVNSIEKIAEGRVWTGTSALQLGLIDKLGTLQDAIQLAAEECGLDTYEIEEHPQKEDWYASLFKLSQIKIENLFFKNILTEEKAILDKIRKIDNLQTSLPFEIKIE